MNKIHIIAGATATGKSTAAIALARKIGGEIISADSMQIYRGMDIGTAKILPNEMEGIPHHLIDELNPDESYNAAIFADLARGRIAEIIRRGKTPIICGGTGFYINALLFGMEISQPEGESPHRAELTNFAKNHGAAALHKMLADIDPAAATAIPINNQKRVIRAIEFYRINGRRISEHNQEMKKRKPAFDAEITILDLPREALYNRINARVDKMMAAGLLNEVSALLNAGYARDLVSMQGLGYKELAAHLANETDLPTAINAIKQGTRRFAKRQITWFKHQLKT
ncbi:MAG: tRNA (adenosine(37)-N6)-dimethylallyltransferase MiaA [Defluviitaleaceae bacterium]|nr:tRNA (adenosine(37)-N6)-dimethylallyltransferase MiaA [Defluviitaleaceae bacterium]